MFLSIIIPVYNTKFELLDRCVQSMLCQICVDWDDIEVIFVNDSSADYIDNCFNKLTITNDHFKYRILQTPSHLGAGMARQYGIDRSKSDWIYFIDSDDELFSKNSLSYIINSIKSNPDKKMFMFTHMNECQGNAVVSCRMTSLYGACFKRTILEQYDIRFLPTILYEDVAFVSTYAYVVGWDAIQNCTDFPVYWYHLNEGSVTQHPSLKDHTQIAFVCDLHCISYINYKMGEFSIHDYSFYIYSIFRLMNETNKIMEYGIQEDGSVLMLLSEVLFEINNALSFVKQNQLEAVASEFGEDGNAVLERVRLFLEHNPLLGGESHVDEVQTKSE